MMTHSPHSGRGGGHPAFRECPPPTGSQRMMTHSPHSGRGGGHPAFGECPPPTGSQRMMTHSPHSGRGGGHPAFGECPPPYRFPENDDPLPTQWEGASSVRGVPPPTGSQRMMTHSPHSGGGASSVPGDISCFPGNRTYLYLLPQAEEQLADVVRWTRSEPQDPPSPFPPPRVLRPP